MGTTYYRMYRNIKSQLVICHYQFVSYRHSFTSSSDPGLGKRRKKAAVDRRQVRRERRVRVLNANKKGDAASLRLSFDGGRPRVASLRISTILSPPPLIRTRQRILPASPEFCITRLFSSYREFERVNAATRAFDGNSEIHFSSATSRDFRMNRCSARQLSRTRKIEADVTSRRIDLSRPRERRGRSR